MEDRLLELFQKIREAIEQDNREALRELFAAAHPADVGEIVPLLEEGEIAGVFAVLGDEAAVLVFQEMEPDEQLRVLRVLGPARAGRLLGEMSSDDVADLLGEVPTDEAGKLLGLMETEEAQDVRELLGYPEDTAGGIMTTEFVALRATMTAQQAIEELRRLAPEAETAYYAYVVDEQEKLVGVLSLRELIIAPPATLLRDIMRMKVISVAADADQEQVARVVAKYDLLAVPVVDEQNRLLGIVTVDDVIDVLEEETTEDIFRFAGTAEEDELLRAPPLRRAVRRLPWLLICLFGDLLSGNVIQGFKTVLEASLVLAFFIPVLMDMGGNVGTQSLAVFVRGIATGQLDRRSIFRNIVREAQLGVTVGAVCGLVLAGVAMVWQGSPALGLVVGAAMAVTLTVAAAMGALVPLVFHKVGIDPAVASGPFITTAVDVTGLFIYFSLASAVMHLLV